MHILFIPAWLSVNKGDKQLGSFFLEQAEALKNKDIKVGFLYLNKVSLKGMYKHMQLIFSNNHKYGIYCEDGINFIIKPFLYFYRDFFNVEERIYKNYIECLNVYIKEYGKPDIIHFQSMNGLGELPYIFREGGDIPIIITEHFSGYALREVSEKTIIQGFKNIEISSKFFAVSNFYRDNLNDLFKTDKIKTLPNNLSDLVILKSKSILKNINFTFICVGNLFPVKKQYLAIKSFKDFIGIHSNAHLNIVGIGPELKKLEKLVEALGLQKNITFLGKLDREQTLSEISKAHVLLVTSKIETFSVVTIEALALQTLVVSTKCGGPEMLINQNNGIICKDEASYTQAMIEIYEKYDSYNLKSIQEDCIEKYSGEKISSLLESEYLEVINRKKN